MTSSGRSVGTGNAHKLAAVSDDANGSFEFLDLSRLREGHPSWPNSFEPQV